MIVETPPSSVPHPGPLALSSSPRPRHQPGMAGTGAPDSRGRSSRRTGFASRAALAVLALAGLAASAGTAPARAAAAGQPAGSYDVRAFGAVGDGRTLDSPAINRAIQAAADAGGGTVEVPAGTYVCGSIHLRSHVRLDLGPGSVIEGSTDMDAYDKPEPNPGEDANKYEDYGHRHWHNSLIWGDGLVDIGITGPGLIHGTGLAREVPGDDFATQRNPNKAIALKECRNVVLRDFSILHGGWFAILAIADDNMTISGVTLDTNRDGMDLDCCQNVRVSDCAVNSPHDDGICLKSCFGLGRPRMTENLTITNCQVSGFDEGTLLDGTYQRRAHFDPVNEGGPTGRIKFGTESNGGFRNITISNCVFIYCRGFALETVDGARIEDVTITNIAMRDIVNAPIWVRIGGRMRGPKDTPVGVCQRVKISNIVAHNVAAEAGILVMGLPGHPVEDLGLDHILIDFAGGGTAAQAARAMPEFVRDYPEPHRMGVAPAYGLFARHARGLTLDHIEFRTAAADLRPPVILDDVSTVDAEDLVLPHAAGVPSVSMHQVGDLRLRSSPGIADTTQPGGPADGSL